jgi:hypothetical protein
LVLVLSFLKACWLLTTHPRDFLSAYVNRSRPLAEFPFPLSGLWRLLSSAPQPVMAPFKCLVTGIALVSFAAGLDMSVLTWSGLIDRKAAEAGEENLFRFFEQQYGKRVIKIDTRHLTGVPVIDGPIGEVAGILSYTWYTLLFMLFVRPGKHLRGKVLHCFAYAMSAALAWSFCLNLAGIAGFALLIGSSLDAAIVCRDLLGLLAAIPIVYLLLILPILVFPPVFHWPRRRVVLATVGGLVAWMASNLLKSALFFTTGLLIS